MPKKEVQTTINGQEYDWPDCESPDCEAKADRLVKLAEKHGGNEIFLCENCDSDEFWDWGITIGERLELTPDLLVEFRSDNDA